ncbi:unnamed protein product [Somion occarium]|uniref:Triacylglycerol lipase n=1 Tax=Somion occarium TaxID=3059160 RepID=A0ABP1E0L2_9APHY
MHTIWFPAPVVVLFRRLVNVVSTFSISHHYLRQRPISNPDAEPPRSWRTFRTLAWVSSVLGNVSQRSEFSLALQGEGEDFGGPEPSNRPPEGHRPQYTTPRPVDPLHTLLNNPVLFDPIRKPRYPIVLCHGLYGFDVRGPSSFPILRTHYWANVLHVLRRRVGAEVIVTGVPGTGSIASRAEKMDKLLSDKVHGRGVNFLAHSMGGLDCRHLISHVQPENYTPVSLTTIGTPHRGSPFMDWCMENIGLGKLRQHQTPSPTPDLEQSKSSKSSFALAALTSLPSSFTTLLLSLLDSPAYANLTSTYLNSIFNPQTPDSPYVKYFSVAGRVSSLSVWHPLWLPKMVLDGFEEKEREMGRLVSPNIPEHEKWGNDGLVTVQSARWGEYLGTLEEADHWALRGARGLELGVELPSISVPGLRGGKSALNGVVAGIGNGKKEGEAWSIGDWSRYVRAWKREEKSMKSAGADLSERQAHSREAAGGGGGEIEERMKEIGEAAMKMKGNGKDMGDEVVKASTDKVSAVFDWIVEQVPSRIVSSAAAAPSPSEEVVSERAATARRTEKSDLSSKADLERFYVALCKKLYDEGL